VIVFLVLAVFVSSGCNLNLPTSEETDPVADTPVPESTVGCTGVIPPGWIEYVVTRGDTLYDLAQLYGSTVDELVAANCLEDASKIVIGDVIYLPNPLEDDIESLGVYLFAPNVIGADGRLAVCGGPVLEAMARPVSGSIPTDIRAMLDYMLGSYIQVPSDSGENLLNPLYSQNLTVNTVRLEGDRVIVRLNGQLQLVGPCFDEQLEAQLVLTAFFFPEVVSAQIFVGGQNARLLFRGDSDPGAVYTRDDLP
jgi:LysM repeat protein